ncbi:MAG: hypothetical protein RIF41_20570 [Polyangiaceae bacterium]
MALAGVGLAGAAMAGATSCRTQIRTCAAGEEIVCDCVDGSQSVQVCGTDDAFEPCQCGGDGGGGVGGGEGGVAIPDFPDGAVMIDVGPDRLVDVFRDEDLIQIVTREQIRVVTLAGEHVSSMPSPSLIRAADLDAGRLVIANDDILWIFNPSLSEVFGLGDLTARCMDLEIVHDTMVLCVPGDYEGQDPSVTYDATSAEPIVATESDLDWYPIGRVIQTVPGTGDIVAVDGYPELKLFRVTVDGSLLGVGASVDDFDDPPFFDRFALLGTPATTLITDKGARRSIYGDECTPELPYWATHCFEHQDFIGQPGVNSRYYAMTPDGPDAYFGLFRYGEDFSDCQVATCVVGSAVLHRYDIASATVTAETLIGEEMRMPIRILPDGDGKGAVVAYERVAKKDSGELPWPGYRVIWVPLK